MRTPRRRHMIPASAVLERASVICPVLYILTAYANRPTHRIRPAHAAAPTVKRQQATFSDPSRRRDVMRLASRGTRRRSRLRSCRPLAMCHLSAFEPVWALAKWCVALRLSDRSEITVGTAAFTRQVRVAILQKSGK